MTFKRKESRHHSVMSTKCSARECRLTDMMRRRMRAHYIVSVFGKHKLKEYTMRMRRRMRTDTVSVFGKGEFNVRDPEQVAGKPLAVIGCHWGVWFICIVLQWIQCQGRWRPPARGTKNKSSNTQKPDQTQENQLCEVRE